MKMLFGGKHIPLRERICSNVTVQVGGMSAKRDVCTWLCGSSRVDHSLYLVPKPFPLASHTLQTAKGLHCKRKWACSGLPESMFLRLYQQLSSPEQYSLRL